ncbi:transglycosylase domain-containing protein [Lacisediminihabitans changchengi]|uniref:Transglycosylase domain-containing protein n=1 Tax=Lacisediminihabitans changchengi TaxID=2787634 RepID=A0A934STP9_9MICO|nr:transglycosylase domain-containing protein [Lacisediminihabitans changchengi]MBK4348803.1 transglycosylase domain-containing protein [Lacisediminihabitans changchengi]
MSVSAQKPPGLLTAILGFVGLSVVAGVLATAMVTPAVAVTGSVASNSIGIFDDLPDSITIGDLPGQNQIFATRAGQPVKIATIYKQNRQEVSSDQISPYLKNAAIDGEDRRFLTHGGVDVQSVVRAALGNFTSGHTQSGSSTLDMQLVKNLLVQQALEITDPKKQKAAYVAAIEDTFDRKLKEMKLAIGLDRKYSKEQILTAYLNVVGMGGVTYGVESGAQRYFSTSANNLTIAQAASLVAIVQQPNLQNLSDPKLYPANKLRRDQILNDMYTAKHITKAELDTALATPIADEVKLSTVDNGCRAASAAPTACDYVSKIITSALDPATTPNAAPIVSALGSTVAERRANWSQGGYKIYTSIDLDLQDVAQTNLAKWTPPTETRFALGGVADSVEAGTGRILVMAQNKTFDDAGIVEGSAPDPTKTGLNLSTDQPYGGSNGFDTGSTFKIFDLANWLQNGHGLNEVVNGNSPQTFQKQNFTTSCDPGVAGTGAFKSYNDAGDPGGYMTVKSALINSVNNAFMQMAQKQDLCSIRDTADTMGAHRADFKSFSGGNLELNPTMIIGTNEQAPLTIAAAAATIGSGGTYCVPVIIDSIVSPSGKKLPGQQQDCTQALTADVAAGVANAMVGSETSGTSRPGNPFDGVAIAGKTGTANTAHQDWAVATTTKVATAVWTGNIDGATTSLKKFTNPITKSNYYSTSRFAIVKAVMSTVNKNPSLKGASSFPTVSAKLLAGSTVKVPDVSGQSTDDATTLLQSLGFSVTVGAAEPSSENSGSVSRTDPAAGTSVSSGQSITIFPSSGDPSGNDQQNGSGPGNANNGGGAPGQGGNGNGNGNQNPSKP